MNSNRIFAQTEVVAYVNTLYPGTLYTPELQAKCYRDVGYLWDAITFDTYQLGNAQSVTDALFYWDGAVSRIPGEIPQTVAAYNFIKAIIGDVITGTPISPKYQTTEAQITNLSPATATETAILQSKIDIITDIIANGPNVAGPQVPVGLTISANTSTVKAFSLLMANKNFIAAEVIAYIANEFGNLQYNKQKCRRDVGLMVDALIADLSIIFSFSCVMKEKGPPGIIGFLLDEFPVNNKRIKFTTIEKPIAIIEKLNNSELIWDDLLTNSKINRSLLPYSISPRAISVV
jgi:hypothetical protein